MQPTIRRFVLWVGVVLGAVHLQAALKAIFVFGNEEPISAWIGIACGPLSTLPAVVTSVFWPKIGGIWLVAGALISFLAFSTGEGITVQQSAGFGVRYTLPMFAIGTWLIFSARRRR